MMDEEMEKKTSKKEYTPPIIEIVYIQMEEGIASGSTVQIGNGGQGIKADPWEDGGSAGTGEPEGEWWN
ncbi:hypothetical protein HZQ11_15730 [Elizabethkingia anophelis]|uniref:hypothetical protein n=1 Tax=Elizabethkingia TaxID=308865 RepID=UPI0007398ABB|nr:MULTISPECIES: hypothetical protein [Elizabethkingia]KUF45594.1 hypothetical protein AS358_05615 [Elizabethkingia anophelis]MCT3645512.1 hypothetical protein [Elizabethkingia anophelis]MCT3646674.1 hypothetical protein [Elizabethkingia anophelis]MCT3652507.1 hypothetical protein [Elizabethkingia anophelis]MCT3656679.1 hypothetical protein [Elizabethkingia anophelis]